MFPAKKKEKRFFSDTTQKNGAKKTRGKKKKTKKKRRKRELLQEGIEKRFGEKTDKTTRRSWRTQGRSVTQTARDVRSSRTKPRTLNPRVGTHWLQGASYGSKGREELTYKDAAKGGRTTSICKIEKDKSEKTPITATEKRLNFPRAGKRFPAILGKR